LKLNLGCGDDTRDGYVNIDIRNLDNKDIVVADITKLQYEKDSIEEILASDIYEHISHLESKNLLKHWNDLLIPEGVLIIRTPSLDIIMQYLMGCKNTEEIESGIKMIFGGQEYKENSHYTICHTQLMVKYLEECNYDDIHYKYECQNIIIKCKKKKSSLSLV